MLKTHYKVRGVDARTRGQSQYDYDHQTACGYVRDRVSEDGDSVDCKLCLRSEDMNLYHHINGSFSDSSGCI